MLQTETFLATNIPLCKKRSKLFTSKFYKFSLVQNFICRASRRLEIVLGSKLYKTIPGFNRFCRINRHRNITLVQSLGKLGGEHRLFARSQVFPSYDLPIP